MSFFTPRQQWAFDLTGIKYKNRAEILTMQRQWDTFERIENYNDEIYHRLTQGLRDKLYYQFKDRAELNDYNAGQQLHILRNPTVDPRTFDSIRDRPLPDIEPKTYIPTYSQVPRNLPQSTVMKASERSELQTDLAVYVHVSTFNQAHVYKYNFTNNDEKLSYHRGERYVLSQQ